MYSFKDVLSKLCVGIMITILIFATGNFIINNVLVHRTKNENIVCTIGDIERKKILVGKVVTAKYRVFTKELDNKISSPQKLIKNMYRNKDEYMGKKINVVKISSYNRKDKLIGIDYELR